MAARFFLLSWSPTMLAAVLVLTLVVAARAQESPGDASPPPDEQRVSEKPTMQALVRRLGDEQFVVREQAAADLLKAGGAAFSALEEGVRSNDREIRYQSQRLLASIRQQAFQRRLEEFAREGDASIGKQLPAWETYRKVLGNSPTTRRLFVEMQREEAALLAAVEEGPREAGQRVNLRVDELRLEMQAMGREIKLGSVAALLLAAGQPDVAVSQQAGSLIYSYCYQGDVREALGGGKHEQQIRRLLGRYIARSDDSSAYQGLVLATQYDIKEGLEPAQRILRDPRQQPYAVQFAILAVARLGDKRHVEVIEPYIQDATHATHRRVGDNNRLVAVQVRDVALAALVHLTGQKYTDYHFQHIQPNPQTVFTSNSACFESDEDREKALQRWRDYRAGKLKNADTPDDGSDAEG